MTIDIPSGVRENPNLMAMVVKANAVVRQEMPEGAGTVRVVWRLDVNAAGRPMLKMTMTDPGRRNAPFGVADFDGDGDALRRRLREWCGRFAGECPRR